MAPVFTQQQDAYRRDVRTFLAEVSSPAAVRRMMGTAQGYDPAVWQAMAERGYTGRHLPSSWGGGGASAVELGILMEELGATLACVPMLSTVMASAALVAFCHVAGVPGPAADDTDPIAADLLGALSSGRRLATVAVTGDAGGWTEDGVAVRASRSGGRSSQWRLDGHAGFVIDGHIADDIVVAARTGGGTTLFVVEGEADGLSRRLLDTLDMTRRLARLEFSGVRAQVLGIEDEGWPVMSRVLDLATAALASEQAGGAGRCLEMSVGYARERVQFGRPIGSFQAIAHRCADMLVEVESARIAARHACRVAADGGENLATAASMAKACCSDAYAWVATETIQVHGGVGFTWDHDAHLYFRRARSSRLLFGDPRAHRERLAHQILSSRRDH